MKYVVRATHNTTGEIIEQCRDARIPSIAREGLVRLLQAKAWGDYWRRANLQTLVRECNPEICAYHK